jgi:hypothetical protein
MNPIRRETAAGMVVMNRGEASEYLDGAIFALFGDHKYPAINQMPILYFSRLCFSLINN